MENLTAVRGRIERTRPANELPDYDLVTVHIEQAHPVPGKADLLSWLTGQSADVLVRRELLGGAEIGDTVALQASRTAQGTIMAEPHPKPRDLSVERRGPSPP